MNLYRDNLWSLVSYGECVNEVNQNVGAKKISVYSFTPNLLDKVHLFLIEKVHFN